MNELHKLFSDLPEEKNALVSGIIDNQAVLLGKEILQTNKKIGKPLELEQRTFESICLTELASKKMLEINAKQKKTGLATQIHYSVDDLEVMVKYNGLIFFTDIKPVWRMETRILFK